MTLNRTRTAKPGKPLAQFSAKRLAELAGLGITNPASTFRPNAKPPKAAVKATKLPALPKVVKPTGEFTGPVADAIEERDGQSCTRCGIGVGDIRGLDYSLQHRRARGNGGSSMPDTGLPGNGIILCGSATSPHCHHDVEQRGEIDRIRGYWIEQWTDGKPTDPTTIPVKHAVHGWVRLDNCGGHERLTRAEAAELERALNDALAAVAA